eukprot:CAMPEP_0197713614 /NCGR_PEP_ID=MMETSP1338-20131121/130549_1 /TAXON_ID=43686 ORGANISM="Pelagodinium beii, Strain RCC1491" /NCGR_SAMPLE_ID=MMETSP1338 /ASSEMBLY_ACC=CAM_ASM_000754 /LENGTH=81 /DNA_ID=CAMNT_0043297555 /DNA_START=593 /DNA_END=838 /DNA_ORIENTATION=+
MTHVEPPFSRFARSAQASKVTISAGNKQLTSGRPYTHAMHWSCHATGLQRLASAHIPQTYGTIKTGRGYNLLQTSATRQKC